MTYAARATRDKRIDWILNPSLIDLDGTWFPEKKDFEEVWNRLKDEHKSIVANCIKAQTYGEVMDKMTITALKLSHALKTNKDVVRALIYARIVQLPTDVARTLYVETLMGNEKSREFHYSDVVRVIKTDREHLKELAEDINLTGDGKRGTLKELIAYGMQARQVEEAKIDEATGDILQPAVIALADPRMAFNALQELNKMDHEYGENDKATSSIESQAERVRRLATFQKKMVTNINKEADKQAKVLSAVARGVSKRELQTLTYGGKHGRGDDNAAD